MIETLEELEKSCNGCTKCKLCQHRTKIVFGVGNKNADLKGSLLWGKPES